LLNCVGTMAQLAPGPAADACQRLAKAAAAPDYGKNVPPTVVYAFQIGSLDISTTNPRQTVLMIAGARLRALAPDRFEKLQPLFAPWDLTAPLTVKATHRTDSPVGTIDRDPRAAALDQRMKQLSGTLTDAQRSQLAIDIAGGIRALPAGGSKVIMARSLANLSTEGDLGHNALTAIGETLAQSLHEAPSGVEDPYVDLAAMIRYEHLTVPNLDPPVRAADALLALREEVHQHAGFTLAGLDGKPYSLIAMRGKVVLLNFWATWCSPCRKEMPDMEKLYRAFEKRGLVVLAVSDEERDAVAGYMAKQSYTFPILLDPEKKAHSAFDVVGIPKSFIFDREGRLVAQAMDMRTERQFRELLKRAGLQ
jgi:peroxiredoxin